MFSWFPLIAHAQVVANTPTIKVIMYRLAYYVFNPLIKLGFVIAFLYFMWGIVDYIRDKNAGRIWESTSFFDTGDKKGKMETRGADRIMYGLLGLFIMASAFGIANLIKGLVGSTIPIQ
jgi:hypothetical protein